MSMAASNRIDRLLRSPATWILLLAPAFAALIALESTRGLMALAALVGLLLLGIAIMVMVRCDVVPSRPVDMVVAWGVLLLPIVPFINTISPLGTALRYALAGAAVMLMGIGLIPVRRGLLSGGGWIIIAFAALQFVPLLRAETSLYGLLRVANWVMFIPFAFIAYDSHTRRIAFASGVAAAILLCFGVVLQVFGILPGAWGGLPLGDGTGSPLATRYTSFILNPNDLGLYLLGVGVLLYVASRQQQFSMTARVLGLSGVATCTAFVLLSASRGAILAAPIVLLFLFSVGDRKAMTHFLTLSVCAFALVLLIPPLRASLWTTVGSVGAILTGSDISFGARVATWRHWLTTDTNPVLGAGYGGYATAAQFAGIDVSATTDRANLYRALTVDNSWLKLWLEQGLLGVVALLAIVAGAIVRCFKVARKYRSLSTAAIGALLVAVVFRAASVDLFDINPWNFILWLLIGLSYSVVVPDRSQSVPQRELS